MSDNLTTQQRLTAAEEELAVLRRNCQELNAQLAEIRSTRSYKASRFIRFVLLVLTFRWTSLREYVPAWRDFRNRSMTCRDTHKVFYYLFLAPLLFVLERICKPLAKQRISPPCGCSDNCRTMLSLPKTYDGYQLMYENNEDYSAVKSPVRCVAFYLPQYHTFPENDQWWGKGFTEWSNTSKSKPRYEGHYQPREPHADWGYYNLADAETLKKQSVLARQHHIDAFCFYYYWFDNKTLMEKPLQLLLQHPEIEQEFCLCWANENWTRAWDGNNSEILIAQDYNNPENDLLFIKSIAPYLKDKRYMRVNNAVVLLVYRLSDLPDPGKTIKVWKDYCRRNGIGELKIWSVRSMFSTQLDIEAIGVDAEVEFPPHPVTVLEKIDNARFPGTAEQEGHFYNYESLVNNIIAGNGEAEHIQCNHNIYRCAMLGWDNSARRSKGWSVWHGFSRTLYYRYLRYLVEYTKGTFKPSERIVFINAWNEWAEGTYLEPDKEFGYAGINVTSRALLGMTECSPYQLLLPGSDSAVQKEKILIHFHCFYDDLANDMLDKLNNMPYVYDCIITTDTSAKRSVIRKALKAHPLKKAKKVSIQVCPNIGRDVAPFMCSVSPVIDNYTIIGHFHTKKSDTVEWGDYWRNYLWDILLGSPEKIRNIFARFAEQEKLGLVFPPTFPMMKYLLNWSGTYERCADLMKKMNFNSQILPEESPIFPAGQMFWARVPAIRDLFKIGITENDFERELGQVEHTLGHAIERLWCYVARANNFDSQMILHTIEHGRKNAPAAVLPKKNRITLLVHYNASENCSPEDLYLTKELSKISKVYVVSNSKLSTESQRKLKQYASEVIMRSNKGFDFGAWRDGIQRYSKEIAKADELLLVNNSCIGPFRPFEEIFAQMEDKECDFWGMSEFPELQNSQRPEAEALPDRTIPAHLQSYFLVLRKSVLQSAEFAEYWKNFKNHSSLLDVVANGELTFTQYFKQAGFRAASYFPLAAWLQMRRAGDIYYNAIYNDAQDFLFLGFPMMKKNIYYCLYQPELLMLQNYIAAMTDYPAEILNFVSKKY